MVPRADTASSFKEGMMPNFGGDTILARCTSDLVKPQGEIRQWFRTRGKYVLTFAGFGEMGYQDKGEVLRIAECELRRFKTDQLIVNTGTLVSDRSEEGIAVVYRIAKEMGFETTGIYPAIGLNPRYEVSPYVDNAFFVSDSAWGGFLENSAEPSPTLRVIVAVSNELIAIGGGKHTADEIRAFQMHKKKVSYFTGEMNHDKSSEREAKTGTQSLDFRGSAYLLWYPAGV